MKAFVALGFLATAYAGVIPAAPVIPAAAPAIVAAAPAIIMVLYQSPLQKLLLHLPFHQPNNSTHKMNWETLLLVTLTSTLQDKNLETHGLEQEPEHTAGLMLMALFKMS